MDWASEEWKQSLTPLAAQKVHLLEDRIEILKKERTQKQLQFECLELALEKEKRKTEKEKQNVSEIQRELQSLADACKDYENKHQKLQNELQSKESRIKNLETLLSQSRKENSKLQIDLKDLSFARENVQSIQEQKLQKRLQEQNSNKSITEDLSIVDDNAKEQALNGVSDNSEIVESLKRKIGEQEELIKKLKIKLTSVPSTDDLLESSNVFKTPAKAMSVTDSPAANGKSTWEGLTSTTAKGNKGRILGHGDSNSIDSGNEKIESLQSRLKQLCQELDCQRFNFEASKNALESKYKESESTLKADLKFQIQANAKLDQELKDSRNKYQQEITQTTKKLDLLTLQLKKSEESKLTYERDIKSLESRIKMNESQLKTKEVELQELQKSKKEGEVMQQSLHSKMRELEKKCKALAEEKALLNENVRAIQMQLEGSNNLVNEKEISLHNVQQQLASLQLRWNELENYFTMQDAKLKDTQVNEAAVKEQLQITINEKRELYDSLNSEIQRNKETESSIADFKQKTTLLEEELNGKESCINKLTNQIQHLENEYQKQIKGVKTELNSSNQKIQSLEHELNKLSSDENTLQEKLKVMDQEKLKLSHQLMLEASKVQELQLYIQEKKQNSSSIKEHFDNKCLELEKEIEILKKEHEKQIQEVNVTLKSSEEQIHSLECELSNLSSEENDLKEKLKVVDQEKIEINSQLLLEASKVKDLELDIKKEKQNSSLVKEKLEKGYLELEELIKVMKEEHEKQIQEVNHEFNTSKEKVQFLECELSTLSSNEINLKEKLELMEQEKIALSNHIMLEASKVQKLELCVEQERESTNLLTDKLQSKCIEFEDLVKALNKEHQTSKHKLEQELCEVSLKETTIAEKLGQMEGLYKILSDDITAEKNKTENLNFRLGEEASKLLTLKEELALKSTELEELHNVMKLSKSQLERQIQELDNTNSLSQAKIADLESELSSVSSNDKNMKEKLNLLEQEKQELSNQLKVKMSEVQQLKMCIEKEKEETSMLEEKLDKKCVELEGNTNAVKALEDVVKALGMSKHDLEQKLQASEQELSLLKDQLHESSLKEASLNEKVFQTEGSNKELSDVLSLESNKINCLKVELEERSQRVSDLEEQLASKSSQLEDLEDQMAISRNELEAKVETLEKVIDTISSNENNLKDKLVLGEEEKLKLLDAINLKTTEIQQLELCVEKKNKESSFLKQQLENKCAELQELKNQVKVLKEFEAKYKGADQKFHAAIEQLGKLQNQLQESSLMEISLKEEIKRLEQLNKDLSDNLGSDIETIKYLKLNLQEESQKKLSLEKDLSSKYLELEQYDQELLNLRCQLEVIQMKLNSTEQEKLNLSEQFKLETLKLQELKSDLQTEKINSLSLKEKLASYCLQIEELSKQMKNVCTVYEAKVKELQERIVTAEEDKVNLLNQLTSSEDRVQKLELSIIEERQTSSKLKEEMANYCQEFEKLNIQIKNLNEVHQEKMLDLESRFSEAEAKSIILETQLKELSVNKIALNDSIDLVNDNNELLSQLASAATKIEDLERSLEKEKEAFAVLKEDMDIKCAKVKELDNKIEVLKKEHKIILQELEDKLNAAVQELSTSQEQLQKSSSMEESLKAKVQDLEGQNQDMYNSLQNEIQKSKCFQEESLKLSTLQEELSLKSSELVELANQMLNSKNQYEDKICSLEHALSSSKAKITSLETEIEAVTSNEDDSNEKLKQATQDNLELSLQMKSTADKFQELESKFVAGNETLSSLQKELENKRLEVEKLHRQVEDCNSKIQMLEAELSSSEIKITSLEGELNKTSSTENSLAEEFKHIMQENSELSQKLHLETVNVQQLESCVEVEKEASLFLKEKLENKCQELEALNCQIEVLKDEKQDQIKKIEKELALVQSEYTTLKHDIKEFSLNEIELKQHLDALVKEKEDLTSQLAEVPNKCLQFEVAAQEQQDQIEKLKNELAQAQSKYTLLKQDREESSLNEIELKQQLDVLVKEKEALTSQVAEVANQCMQFEMAAQDQHAKVKELQEKFSSLETKNKVLETQFKESSLDKTSAEEKIVAAEKDKVDLLNQLKSAEDRVQKLELTIEEEQQTSSKLKEEMANYCQEFEKLDNKIKNLNDVHQDQINKLENELALAQSKYITLKQEREEYSSLNEEWKQRLDVLVEEKEDLTVQMAEVANKCMQFQMAVQEQEDQIKKLENELARAQSEYSTLKQERGESSLNEMELKQQLDALVKEKEDLTSQVAEVANKYQQFETASQEQQNKIQDLESGLSSAQDELQAYASREQSLVANLAVLEKENEEANEKISSEWRKTEKLQLFIEELSKSCASFEQELSNKTTLLNEAKTLTNDFQVQIQNLENKLTRSQEDFENHLHECSMNEKNLNNNLSVLKNKSMEISEELAAESVKTEKLEILVEELKLSYTSIKEKLNEVNKREVALQKLHCGRNVQSPHKLALNSTPKKALFSSDSVSFGYPVANSVKEEVEHSQSLHKLSLCILEEMAFLEEDLITKADLWKFLYCYNLIGKEKLSCLWKKFMPITKRLQVIQYLKKLVSGVENVLKLDAMPCQIDNTNIHNVLLEEFYFRIQDIFYLSGDNLNNFLFSISQTLQQNKMEIRQFSITKYSSVNTNMLPVLLSTKFLISLHQLNKTFIDSELKLRKQNRNIGMDFGNVVKALKVLKVQDLPYFLNYAVTLTEYIGQNICEAYSNLQLNPQLNNLAASSSPLLHLTKQYLFDCLDTNNVRSLSECIHWKQHHNILGLSEFNMERVVSIFERKLVTPETAKGPSVDIDLLNLGINSEKAKDPSIDVDLLKEELIASQKALSAEKEKQVMLNATIEEIEMDLGETFQQKERYMKMVLDVSNVLAKLKDCIATTYAFDLIKLEDLSSEYCYCETCVLQEEIDLGNHNKLILQDLFTHFKKFDSEVESKLPLNQQADLVTMCKDLQDRNSELAMDVVNSSIGSKDAHDEIKKLRDELMKEKENYQRIYETADRKDNTILELETFNINLSIENEKYQMKIDSYEEEICKLSEDLKELTNTLSFKQKEIATFEKSINDDALMLEDMKLQCKEYENKIQLLNSTISKYEEEKALDKHLSSLSDRKSQNTIFELQDEIKNLKQTNHSLNLTIETIEDELKTVYSEKQNDEELEKITMQNVQLREEASNATQKYISEQQTNKMLLSKIEKYEAIKISSDNTIKELKTRIEILDKDICLLKGALGDHGEVIFKKNSSLKLKDQIIDRLNLKITELEQENLDLNMQLEENVSTDNPLQLQLSRLTEQRSEYEGEIRRLKLVETDNIKLLEKINEIELQRDGLIKDATLLQTELMDANEQVIHCETIHEELMFKLKETCDALNEEVALKNILEKKLNYNQNAIKELENQIQTLKLMVEEFKLDNTQMKEKNLVLVNKVEELKFKIQGLNNSLEGAYQKQRSILVDNEELIAELKQAQSLANKTCEIQNLRNVLTSANLFITNILDVTIGPIKNYPEAQNVCSDLLSAMEYWKQGSETEPKADVSFIDLFKNLKYFYETVMNKLEEERAIRVQVTSIIYSLNSFGEFCELSAQKYKTSNSADVTNMSMFETTVGDFIDVANVKSSATSFVSELQQVKTLLDEYFSTVKCTIHKQTEEIEMLKGKLTEVSFTQVSSVAEPTDKLSFESKYNIYRVNYRKLAKEFQDSEKSRLELKEHIETLRKEKHCLEVNCQKLEKERHDLQKTCHEMKGHIETLQKEKQDLEEEAEELAADFKRIEDQLYNSNELAETLTKLAQAQQKLKNSENENNFLKKRLDYCQSNHGKKSALGAAESGPNVLATTEHKENVLRNGSEKFVTK